MLFLRLHSSLLCFAYASASFVSDKFVTTDEQCSCSSPSYLVSSTVKLSGITYYVPPKPIIIGTCFPVFVPTTIIEISPSDLPITSAWLNNKINKFIATDDVFTPDFLASISFVSRPSLGRAFTDGDLDLADFLKQWEMTRYITSVINWKEDELIEGPYFLSQEGMKQAWRVYEDPLDAFQVGVVPSLDDPNSFQPLPISTTSGAHLSIAVPSRLYYPPPTPQKPLSGLRIGIKDIIDLSGLPTSHQSRAYLALNEKPLVTTASAIQNLINKGAVIVGKTRTTQFAAGEQASGDWVDFLAPWNPRGDGWQVPGMSSAGSASAVSGYDWIDGAVGSDTLGSMTGPAAAQGLFGNRISTGILNLDGVMPITEVLDTLGFFARDITIFNTVLKAWLPGTTNGEGQGPNSRLPKTLIYPTDYFPLSPLEVQEPISAFIAKLELFLHVRKSEISFAEEWKKTASFAKGVDIRDYLKTVVSTLQLRGSWDNSRGFADEYKKVFNREMEVHPQVKHKWKLGAKITDEQKEEAERKMQEYMQWLDEQFFGDGCESGLVVLPLWEIGEVIYRNEYRGPPEEVNYIGMGWYGGLEPVLAGLPVVVVPVGQFPYESRMTERKEWLPVGLAVVAARNCDVMLSELLQKFLGLVGMESVKTGRVAFDVEKMSNPGDEELEDEVIHNRDEL